MAHQPTLVFSYLALRKVIGILGTAFPFVLALGALFFFRTGLQDSLSSYYHTDMRDVFVGTLFVIGFFLLSYKGYERKDDIAGNLACVFAVGLALFPVDAGEKGGAATNSLVGILHYAFALLLFLTLIYFALFLFTKMSPKREPTPKKLQRNMVYRACGYVMSGCVLLMILYVLFLDDAVPDLRAYAPIFWLEAFAVIAFGISWATKGEAILKDED